MFRALGVAVAMLISLGWPALASEGDGVTADIRVELSIPSSPDAAGPLVIAVTGVPVTDAVEMPSGSPVVANPSFWCGDATVDLAADLSAVTVTGGLSCDFETAVVTVTVHGATFLSAAPGADDLFQGTGAIPVLQSAVAFGDTFTASWAGTAQAYMPGTASFSLNAVVEPAAEPAPAPAPVVAVAEPAFTG